MGDWQSGNLGRLNATIQAQAEAGRIKESKKNRFASIAEGLANNLFKRQSETAQQAHDIKLQKLLYGETTEPTMKQITTNAPTGTPNAPGGDYATFMQQFKPRTETVPDQPGGYKPGILTESTKNVENNRADLDAASRSRSYEEYVNTMKRMGKPPQLTQQDYLLGWPPRYGDSVDKEKGVGDLWTVLNITADQLGRQNSPTVVGDPNIGGFIPDTTKDKEVYKKQVLETIHARKGDDEVTTYLAKTFPKAKGGIDWKAADAAIAAQIDTAWTNATQTVVGAEPDMNAYRNAVIKNTEETALRINKLVETDWGTDVKLRTRAEEEVRKQGFDPKESVQLGFENIKKIPAIGLGVVLGQKFTDTERLERTNKYLRALEAALIRLKEGKGKTYTDVLDGIKTQGEKKKAETGNWF